jgi:hypothetical protein
VSGTLRYPYQFSAEYAILNHSDVIPTRKNNLNEYLLPLGVRHNKSNFEKADIKLKCRSKFI